MILSLAAETRSNFLPVVTPRLRKLHFVLRNPNGALQLAVVSSALKTEDRTVKPAVGASLRVGQV
jgi:hypothetical protein